MCPVPFREFAADLAASGDLERIATRCVEQSCCAIAYPIPLEPPDIMAAGMVIVGVVDW